MTTDAATASRPAGKPYHLVREQLVPRPRAEVFAFFAEPGNLERITPGTLRFRIVTPQPIAMRAGTVIDYRLSLFGLPFAWRTLIEELVPGERFVDVQTRGPYALWRHTHTFADAGPGGASTLVRDHVQYALPFGPLGRAVHRLLVKRQLARIFDHRQRVITSLLG